MEQRRFGSTKREVAVIGQEPGTLRALAPEQSAAPGLDLGMTHIDTARCTAPLRK